jgi:hypothetical protein
MSKLSKLNLLSLIPEQSDLLYIVCGEMTDEFPAYRFAVDENNTRSKVGMSVVAYLPSDELQLVGSILTSYAQGYLRGIQRSI